MLYHIKDLQDLINVINDHSDEKHVVIEYSATFCEPCKKVKGFLESLSKNSEYDNIIFCYIDWDLIPESDEKEAYNIEAFPTTRYYLKGLQKGEVRGNGLDEILEDLEYMTSINKT